MPDGVADSRCMGLCTHRTSFSTMPLCELSDTDMSLMIHFLRHKIVRSGRQSLQLNIYFII